jgi:parallel beta-helix repeat protein
MIILLTSVVLLSGLAISFNVRLVYSELLVRNLNTGLNYTKIQDAINAPQTLNGHTIMAYSGTYYENVVVNKSISLVGENRITTTIFGGNVTDVVLVRANNANVTDFTIRSGMGPIAFAGITVLTANGCGISGNILTQENVVGVRLMSALNTRIIGNIFNNNGLAVSYSYGSTVINNTVNGRPIVYVENGSNLMLTGATGQVIIVKSFNITVRNSVLTHTSVGVQVRQSNSCRIINNDLSNNFESVSVSDAWDTRIIANSMVNTTFAIVFTTHVYNGIVSGNNIKNNYDGMEIWYSANTLIFGNTIESSERYGIYMYLSYENVIHHNDFRNTDQVQSVNSTNIWDDGYPSGGNYWSDYTGSDHFSGPYQNQTGSDGIGDTPYVIDVSNRDRYPILVSSTTVTGSNVQVSAAADVRLTFQSVTMAGYTTVAKSSAGPAPPPGGNWMHTYYDIATTAVYGGTITVKINYDDSGLTPEQESSLKLVQWNSTAARSAGDITGYYGWPDGRTDIKDLALAAKAFGSYPGHPRWNPIADMNGDLKVDIKDLALMAKHYGQISFNWVNITTYVDTTNNIIHGVAPHLSIFTTH